MITQTKPITKTTDLYINPNYEGRNTFAVSSHKLDYIVAKDGLKDVLIIDIEIKFTSQSAETIIKANLRSITDFQITTIHVNDQSELISLLMRVYDEMVRYLKVNLPNNMIETTEPLIQDTELIEVADGVFSLLSELGFYS